MAIQKHEENWDIINYSKEPLNGIFQFPVEEIHSVKNGEVYGRNNGFFNVYIVDNSIVELIFLNIRKDHCA